MQITLKLYANLSEYLPAGTKKHRIVLDISHEETAYAILARRHVPKEKAHLVLLNGVYLTPEQREQPPLLKQAIPSPCVASRRRWLSKIICSKSGPEYGRFGKINNNIDIER